MQRLYVDLPLDMDFIFGHALLSAVGLARDRAPRALPGGKECNLKNASPARSDEPFLLDVERTAIQETHEQFTPGDFFKEAGTIIAVCLALGLLMQFLLT